MPLTAPASSENAVLTAASSDGARLSFEGLPCPNLSTGGENFHSRFEYVPTEDLYAMVDVLEAILVP